MTHWNYRVLLKGFKADAHFDIYEVYYEGDRIHGWTDDLAWPSGDTPEELAKTLDYMQQAHGCPVLRLVEEGGKTKLVEVEIVPLLP